MSEKNLQELSARSSRSSKSLAAAAPGVSLTGLSAAERYEVQPYYRRFEQKMNMTRQTLWRPEAMELAKEMARNRLKLVQGRKRGYSLLDWALYNAANTNIRLTGFNINRPNTGATAWKTSGSPLPEGLARWTGDATANAKAIKKVAGLFGAGDTGIALLDRRWVYSHWFDEQTRQSYPVRFSDEPGLEHVAEPVQLEDKTQVIPASMKYVVVCIVPMDRQGIRAAPTMTQFAATMISYSTISRLVASLAEFIRGLGYHAIPSSNCTALNIPLAVDAGLGELGRHAKLIHPVWGSLCRICKVITDLPLAPDLPVVTGASLFCESCGKCADACPSEAIPRGPRSFEPVGDFSSAGVKQWQLDHWKCYKYWSKVGTNCGRCLAACPFSKGGHWTHTVTKAAIARLPKLDPLIVAMDDAFGYGETDLDDFWGKDGLLDE